MSDPLKIYLSVAHSRFDRNVERMNRNLGITNENATIPMVASRSVSPSVTVDTDAREEVQETVPTEQVEAAAELAPTEAVSETPTEQTTQAQETVQEPVNTEPTTEQRNQISLLKKEGYKIPDENITVLDDGSVKITVKTKNSTNIPEIIFNNKGKIVSAKNITGNMLTFCLFKGNSSVSQAAYELAPGEDDEKTDNFNKGRYAITTDSQGNLIITFIKKYEKPAEESETTSAEDYSNLTSSDSGEIIQDFNPGSSVADQTAEETINETPKGTYILVTPDGKASLKSGGVPAETVTETEEQTADETSEAPAAAETPQATETPVGNETPAVTESAAETPQATEAPSEIADEAAIEGQATEAAEAAEEVEEAAQAEETNEAEELLSEDKLNSILEFVTNELNIDSGNIDNVDISEKTDDQKNRVILIAFTVNGENHTAEYYPEYDKTYRIDGKEIVTYTDTGTTEAQKAMGSLKLVKDEERSNSTTNVFNHNNISVAVSVNGTQVYDQQLQIDGKTINGTIIDNDKVDETLNAINPQLKAKIEAVVGSNGADRIIYIENEYNTWAVIHHHDIKVVALKDVEVDGEKYTNSVVYTFDKDGNLTKAEYSTKGQNEELVSFEKVQTMAEVMGVSATELILGADNFQNYWHSASYERDAHEEGERPVYLYYSSDYGTRGKNLNYEQASRFLTSQMPNIEQFFKDKGLDINWEDAYISVYSSNDYYNAEYEEKEPIEDAKYFEYSIVVEIEGKKYIFGANGTQCVIINEHGAVDKKFAQYTIEEDYNY